VVRPRAVACVPRAQARCPPTQARRSRRGRVAPPPAPPQGQRCPLPRLRGQVRKLLPVSFQIEELLSAVQRVKDVLEPPIGQGVPMVLPTVANIVFEIDESTPLALAAHEV